MLVVLPYHSKDAALALSNLEWARKLDGSVPFDALVVCPEGQSREGILELAKTYFAKVHTAQFFIPFTEWPAAKNFLFQRTADWVYQHTKQPFLWWEPDAVLLRKGAFTAIAKEVEESKALFSGCWMQSGWMDLVGVWPSNTIQLCERAMLSRAAPFDQVAGKEIGDKVHHSPLFQCLWDVNGFPPEFKTKDDLQLLNKEAVIFHRDKKGSLVKVLDGKLRFSLPKFDKPERSETCIIQLGRYGDIINVLPIAQSIAESTGQKPCFMVAKDYAGLLEGCSYVEPVVWNKGFTDLTGAVEQAQEQFSNVIVAQVNSRNVGVSTQCSSFTEESWRQAGYLGDYTKLPLTFDKRSEKREASLVEEFRKTNKPLLLVNLDGVSSPYAHKKELLEQLYRQWANQYEILDLAKVKCARVFDLLGLFDVASVLITIDTATLHLATASTVPVIALIVDTPTPWHGSRPRCNCVVTMHYKNSPHRFPEIHKALEQIVRNKTESVASNGTVKPFREQTPWPCGQVNLPLDKNISHFNPGLCRDDKGRLWMIARKSVRGNTGKFNSTLLLCEMTEGMEVKSTRDLKLNLKLDQHEDPRVIFKNGKFYISFCGWSRKPLVMPKQVIIAWNNGVVEHVQVIEYGKNTNYVHGVEKNWIFFGAQGRFHFVYQFTPHTVVAVEGNQLVEHVTGPQVEWPYGEIRGGTPPIQVGEEFLTFFHSSLFMRQGKRRYYMGAYTFEAQPPFAVKRITKSPLLVGSEKDTCLLGGPPCIFPCGADFNGKEWLVTFGVNDEACGWIKIPHEDLEKLLCN